MAQAMSTNGTMVTAAGKGSRGSSYSSDELTAVAHAWVAASENSVRGVCQPKDVFWNKVAANHAVHKPHGSEERMAGSIRATWKKVQERVNKFVNIYAQIKALNPSGKTDDDIYNMAVQRYLEVTNEKKWQLKDAWIFL
jgi:hypothetical protein